jgi:hypothetical protein
MLSPKPLAKGILICRFWGPSIYWLADRRLHALQGLSRLKQTLWKSGSNRE